MGIEYFLVCLSAVGAKQCAVKRVEPAARLDLGWLLYLGELLGLGCEVPLAAVSAETVHG